MAGGVGLRNLIISLLLVEATILSLILDEHFQNSRALLDLRICVNLLQPGREHIDRPEVGNRRAIARRILAVLEVERETNRRAINQAQLQTLDSLNVIVVLNQEPLDGVNKPIAPRIVPDSAHDFLPLFGILVVLEQELIHGAVNRENVASDIAVKVADISPDKLERLVFSGDNNVILHHVIGPSGKVPIVAALIAIEIVEDCLLQRVDIPSSLLIGLAILLI